MYVPTIHLTDSDMVRLSEGTLRLRCGQWVLLPRQTRPSRWVGTRTGAAPYTLWAAHWQGGGGRQQEQFVAMARCGADFLPVTG